MQVHRYRVGTGEDMLRTVKTVIKLIRGGAKAFKIAKKIRTVVLAMRIAAIVLGCLCLAGIPFLVGAFAAHHVKKQRGAEIHRISA